MGQREANMADRQLSYKQSRRHEEFGNLVTAKPNERCRSMILAMAMALALQLPLFFLLLHVFQSGGISRSSFARLVFILPYSNSSSSPTPLRLPSLPKPAAESTAAADPPPPSSEEAGSKQVLKPYGVGHYTFVEMSAYRESLRTFFVIGITSVILRGAGPPVLKCEWHPNNETHELDEPRTDESSFKQTEANIMYIDFDENGELYVPAIVNCTFKEEVGEGGEGGLLAISVFVGGRFVKEERVLAMREKRNEAEKQLQKQASPEYKYAFCGPPIFKSERAYWFLHWLVYHHYMFEGKAHFFFYNVGGVSPQARMAMAPFLQAGLLTIIDVPEQKLYLSWYFNQLLFINDCLHRSKFVAKWVAFHDFDEFLDVQPPHTVHSLLLEHSDKAWITYGNIPASTGHCRLPLNDLEWPLERVLCRDRVPECMDNSADPWMCLASTGRRKYIASTRRVVTSGVHRVAVPAEGGVDLNSSVARVYHYRSALSAAVNPCGLPVNVSLPEDQLRGSVVGFDQCNRDDSFAHRVHAARQFAANLLHEQSPSSN